MSSHPCGWYGSISNFLSTTKNIWLQKLSTYHQTFLNEPASKTQEKAWENCYSVLQSVFTDDQLNNPTVHDWPCIFEYELPRERGRRPDVIILTGSQVLVLEFKDFVKPLLAHIDQVAAYARDIQHYHAASHDLKVIPVLVLTLGKSVFYEENGVYITSPDYLGKTIISLTRNSTNEIINPEEWLVSDYAPLPSLINAARIIFEHEPLPFIRRAHSAGIPQTIAELVKIAKEAQSKRQYHLALVTGVPGAGKTLVGIQFVYENHFADQGSNRTAVFLSGNGPLVKVLQHALKSSVFVQDVHGFLRTYGGTRGASPAEHIYIFDEAQRAWDSDRVKEKRGHHNSEPEDFLQIGERKSWSLMIGLIGDGQEIHIGEEAGLAQWNTAIAKSDAQWYVHCPHQVAALFTAASGINRCETLNLTASLRSHLAEDVQNWVKHLLEGNISEAANTATRVQTQGFNMYLTTDLEFAKNYLLNRYEGHIDQRYGILASSKAKNLHDFSIRNGYQFTKNLREGPWYNDPPDSSNSCCQLREVATEFACQGLELDFPLIAWGNDLRWHNHRWVSPPISGRNKAKNPHKLRINSYRVLLSRGRDGFVIFIPPTAEMESTRVILLQAGVMPLN
jgi:hypothetical protein